MGTSPSKSDSKSAKKISRLPEDLPDEYKITVINPGIKNEVKDPSLELLEQLPVIPSILEAADSRRYVTDNFNILATLSTYQQILGISAKDISENQDKIHAKIVPTMLYMHQSLQRLNDQSYYLSQAEEGLSQINMINDQLMQCQEQMANIVSFIDQLESLIPADELAKHPSPLYHLLPIQKNTKNDQLVNQSDSIQAIETEMDKNPDLNQNTIKNETEQNQKDQKENQ